MLLASFNPTQYPMPIFEHLHLTIFGDLQLQLQQLLLPWAAGQP